MKVIPQYRVERVGGRYKIMIEAFYKKKIERKFWFPKIERVWGWYQTNNVGGVLQTGANNSSGLFKNVVEATRLCEHWKREAKPIKI